MRNPKRKTPFLDSWNETFEQVFREITGRAPNADERMKAYVYGFQQGIDPDRAAERIAAGKRDVTPRRAEIIRRHLAQHERAREEFDPRRYKRGGGYSPDDVRIIQARGGKRPSNRALGKLEVHEFMQSPPERLFAYYDLEKMIVTFTRGKLGSIIHTGRVSRPMGGRVIPVRVRAINGYLYSGRCNLSSGTYCRLRRGKRWRTS